MADLTLTVDGKKIAAPAGTLLIEACKNVGIEVPSFCYYPNLSLQGACRMCLVKVEKMPKLQTACTTVVGEGMVVTSDSDEIRQARKSMVEMLLGNPMTVNQIARLVDEPPNRVTDDLIHLFRSLKHTEYKAVIESARCRACGFEFSEEKLTKPSKCPKCHSTWIFEPKIGIENRTRSGEARSK